MIKLPILITEQNGDKIICNSIEEAEIEMEPIDVERGEYVVTDADGEELSVVVVTEEVSLFCGLWSNRIKKTRIMGFLKNACKPDS